MTAYRANQARRGIVPRQFDTPEINAAIFAALAMLVRDGHSPREAFMVLLSPEDQWPAMSDARHSKLADAAVVLDVIYSPPAETSEHDAAESECCRSVKPATKRAEAIQQLAEAQEQTAAMCVRTTELATVCVEQAEKIAQLYTKCSILRERVASAKQALSVVRKKLDRLAPIRRLNNATNGDLNRLAELHDAGYRLADLLLAAGGIDEKHVATVRKFMKIMHDPSPLNRLRLAGMLAFKSREQPLKPRQAQNASAAA